MKTIRLYLKRFLALIFLGSVSALMYGQQNETDETIIITQPPLPYGYDDLEPFISAQTLMLHYGKHLKGYIDNVNKMIKTDAGKYGKDLESIVKNSTGKLYNNAAQAWNHNFYFETFAPKNKALHKPTGSLANAIDRQWGSFEQFKKSFAQVAGELFGSGWVWLVRKDNGSLEILGESNAGNILNNEDATPLLGIDVWEHAYYVDYQNRRADHIDALWNIIDWKKVEDRYNAAVRNGK